MSLSRPASLSLSQVVMADGRRLTPASFNLVLAELTAPNIRDVILPQNEITVFEGMDNDIICDVFSIPHATITWRLDGIDLTEGFVQVWFRFIDATTHLYKRSCPSVRLSVGPLVRMSRVIFKDKRYAY